jgi:hypothetical protein
MSAAINPGGMVLAGPTDTDDAFIREVDDEFRRDKLARFWTRYGRWLLIALGLFLIALAAVLYWREERARAAGELGAEFNQALQRLDAGNVAGARPVLEKAAAADQPGYRALGRLALAAAAAREGKTADAVKLYGELAADDDLPQPFRDLASIRQLMLQFDSLPNATLIERLQPFAKPGNPWFGTAGEMLAIAYMRGGKPELAAPLFAAVARDPGVPASIRTRTAQIASMLGANPFPAAPAGPAGPAAAPAKADR